MEKRIPDLNKVRMLGSEMRQGGFKMAREACERISSAKTVGGHIPLGAAHGRVSIGRDRDFRPTKCPLPGLCSEVWDAPVRICDGCRDDAGAELRLIVPALLIRLLISSASLI